MTQTGMFVPYALSAGTPPHTHTGYLCHSVVSTKVQSNFPWMWPLAFPESPHNCTPQLTGLMYGGWALKRAISSISGEPTLSSSLAGPTTELCTGWGSARKQKLQLFGTYSRGGAQWLKEVFREKRELMSGWRAGGGSQR